MYNGRFIKARDRNGAYYRDEKTGDLINYCHHDFIVRPRFEIRKEYHAGFIAEECTRLDELQGVCRFCGEIISIPRDNIFTKQEHEKEIESILKEMEERNNFVDLKVKECE